MARKVFAKGIRIAQKDIDTVEICQDYYGLGTFSDAIRFVIRDWRRRLTDADAELGLALLEQDRVRKRKSLAEHEA